MRGTLKLMSLRLINEKTPLFNLYSSLFLCLCVLVADWLPFILVRYYYRNKKVLK